MKKYIFLVLSLLSMHAAFAGSAPEVFLLRSTESLGFKGLTPISIHQTAEFIDLDYSAKNKTGIYPLFIDNDEEEDDDGFINIDCPDPALNNDPTPELIETNIRALREMGEALFFLENRINLVENENTHQLHFDGPFDDPAFGPVFIGLINPQNRANMFNPSAEFIFDGFRASLLIFANDVIRQLETQLAQFEFNILTQLLTQFANQNPEVIDIIELEKLISAIITLRERIYQRPHLTFPNGNQGGMTPLIDALYTLEEEAQVIVEEAEETRSEDELIQNAIQTNASDGFLRLETEAAPLWDMILDFQNDRDTIVNTNDLEALLPNYGNFVNENELNDVADDVLGVLFAALDDYIGYMNNNRYASHPATRIIEALEILGTHLDPYDLEENLEMQEEEENLSNNDEENYALSNENEENEDDNEPSPSFSKGRVRRASM